MTAGFGLKSAQRTQAFQSLVFGDIRDEQKVLPSSNALSRLAAARHMLGKRQ